MYKFFPRIYFPKFEALLYFRALHSRSTCICVLFSTSCFSVEKLTEDAYLRNVVINKLLFSEQIVSTMKNNYHKKIGICSLLYFDLEKEIFHANISLRFRKNSGSLWILVLKCLFKEKKISKWFFWICFDKKLRV